MAMVPLTLAQLASARRSVLGAATVHGLRVEVLRYPRTAEIYVIAAVHPETDALVWQTIVQEAYMAEWSATVTACGDEIEVIIDGENTKGGERNRGTFVLSTTGEVRAHRST